MLRTRPSPASATEFRFRGPVPLRGILAGRHVLFLILTSSRIL